MSIKTVKTRKALPPNREPYWESIGHGKTLGYRISKSGMGTWVAKLVRQGDRRKHTIGDPVAHARGRPVPHSAHAGERMVHGQWPEGQ